MTAPSLLYPPAPPAERGGLDMGALMDMASGLAVTALDHAAALQVDPIERTGLRLIGTDLYDVWLLRWPVGTAVTPHDHGVSAAAFTVVSGQLTEIRWPDGSARLRVVTPGTVVGVERGVIHDVIGGMVPSLSVHVYSPPLTSMSFYGRAGEDPAWTSDIDGSSLFRGSPARSGE